MIDIEILSDKINDEVCYLTELSQSFKEAINEEEVREKALEQIDKQIKYEQTFLYWLRRKRKMFE